MARVRIATSRWRKPQYILCNDKGEDITTIQPALFKLLFALLFRPILPEDDIYGVLWPDPDKEPECAKNTIAVYIYNLRKKLQLIDWDVINHHGRGYTLMPIDQAEKFRHDRREFTKWAKNKRSYKGSRSRFFTAD